MARRGTKSGGGEESPTTPLKGALTEEKDPNNLALAMLLERLDSMERERRLEAQALQSALTASTEQVKQIQLAMAEEKRRTSEAIEALHQQMVKVMESRPTDPQTQQAMVRQLQVEARKEMKNRKEKFLEELKTMPTGTIRNETGESKKFIINGVEKVFKPGINRKVPKVFIEAWKTQDQLRDWAKAVDRGFQSYDKMQDANTYNMRRGAQPFWDEKVGMVG